jgi:hypothetical protein
MVLAGILALLGIWVFLTAQHRMGLTPGKIPQAERTGTADVRSCSSDPLYLWVTWTCETEVRWDGEQGAAPERVISVHELTGTVDIYSRTVQSGRNSTSREVVPADFPGKSDGALFFVMMMGLPVVGAAAGFSAGTWLARFLPEPPERPRELTLRSKMSGRWQRGKRFNGPRKRRR